MDLLKQTNDFSIFVFMGLCVYQFWSIFKMTNINFMKIKKWFQIMGLNFDLRSCLSNILFLSIYYFRSTLNSEKGVRVGRFTTSYFDSQIPVNGFRKTRFLF